MSLKNSLICFKLAFICILSSCVFIQKDTPLKFQSPLKKYNISQKYKTFKRDRHLGIDLKAPLGTKIHSIAKGRVVYVGQQFSGYGKLVIIEHGKNWTSLYAHLNHIKVTRNQKVNQGDIIGRVGNTGKTTGVHLHLELFLNKKNVNPLNFLSIK